MPGFDTQTPPERRNRSLRLRIVLLANRLRRWLIASKPHILSVASRLRTLLIATKPRVLSIANRLRSLLIANRLRTLLTGGVLLLFVVTAPVGLFIYSPWDAGVPGPGYYDLDDRVSCDSYVLTKTGDCVRPESSEYRVYCEAENRSQVDEFTTTCS